MYGLFAVFAGIFKNGFVVGSITVFVRCVGSDHSDRPNCKLHTLKTPEAAQYAHMCMCVCQLAVSRDNPCFYITQRYSVFVMFYSVSILSVYGFVLGFSAFFLLHGL